MPTLVDFAALPFAEFEMRAINTRVTSPMTDRASETADFGTPYWRLVSAVTGPLLDAEIDEAETFLQAASRGGACFACHDVYRPRPRAYGSAPLTGTRAGGGAFDGTATLLLVDDSRTITVSELPAGFEVNKGALVEIRKTTFTRSLHRVMAPAVASAGGVVTLSIDFALDTGVFTAANSIVNFEKPACIMQLQPGFSMPKRRGARVASFTAQEVFPNG